jgi:prepilin-type N-terminal cleavage/methylation domain-containing protein
MEWGAMRHAPQQQTRRPLNRGQNGLTLIELLVATAILTVIGGSIAGAFAIGLRALGSDGAPSRLTGSHDLLAFEQQIGADIARSVCLSAPVQTSLPSGGCTASVQKGPSSTCGTGYLLCLAYYLPGSTPVTCHTVTYSQLSDDSLVRNDNGTAGRFTTGGLTGPGAPGHFATWTNSIINGYNWTKQVVVTVTQQGTPNAPTSHAASATYYLVPLISDPESPVSGGTSPC